MCTYLKEAEDGSSHGGRGEGATSGAQLGADPPPVPSSSRGAPPRGARTPRTHGAPARILRACPPAWRAGRGAHPPGEKGEGHADLGQRRLWAAPAAALLAGGRLGFVDREGSGRGISTDTNGRWPAREVRLRAGHFTHRGTMDISPVESHLSELLYRYLLTEHG